MKNFKLLRTAVILLLCTNLFFIYKLSCRPMHPPKLSVVVNAKGAHAKALDAEMRKHRIQVLRARKSQLKLRQRLIQTQPFDAAKRRELLQQIATLQFQIDSITICHFDRVHNLCTSRENQKFDDFKKRIIQPKDLH